MSVPFSLGMLALLMTAAWRDLASRTIPDAICLLLVAVGALWRLLDGPSALAISVGTSLLIFILLLVAHSRGVIGGGDVKIMSAVAVGLSPLGTYRFMIATAVAGGILAIVYLFLTHKLRGGYKNEQRSLLGRVVVAEAWRIRRRGTLPYGVAIAAGGAFVLLHSGSF